MPVCESAKARAGPWCEGLTAEKVKDCVGRNEGDAPFRVFRIIRVMNQYGRYTPARFLVVPVTLSACS